MAVGKGGAEVESLPSVLTGSEGEADDKCQANEA